MKKRKNILDFQKFFEKVKSVKGGMINTNPNSSTEDKNKNPVDKNENPPINTGAKVQDKTKTGPVRTTNTSKDPVKEKQVKIFVDGNWIYEINWKNQPWFKTYQERMERYKEKGEGTRERVASDSAFLLKNKKACHYLIVGNNTRIFGVEKSGKILKKPNEKFPQGEQIDKKSCKKFGEKVKIEDLQRYYYYINEFKTGRFRVIKFLSKDDKNITFFLSDGKKIEEPINNNQIFYKLDPEEKDQKSLQAQSDKLPDDLQALLDKVNKAQSASELPFSEIRDLFEKYKDLKKGEIEIVDKDEKEKKIDISESIVELGDDLDDLKKESDKNESIYYEYEVYDRIFEGGLTYQPGGTGGGGNPGGGSSDPKTPQVRERFEKTFEVIEKDQNLNLTQNEVDEMNDLLKSGTMNYSLDVSARPDPVVNVVAVFTDAHELYYTDPIPSGRPEGRVSNNTFRQYLKLGKPGTGRDGKPSDPSGSVYAVKSIFNEWKNGVRAILKDPAYAMISKIKFKIPGKEEARREAELKKDNYFYNSEYNKIYEEYDEDKGKLVSTNGGKALIEFMIRATNTKNLDDFETLCDDLLFNNFQIEKGKYSDKVGFERSNQTPKSIMSIEDVSTDNLKFNGQKDLKTKLYELTNIKPDNLMIMSFKCKDSGTDKNYIFCGQVKEVKDKYVEFKKIHFFKGKFEGTTFQKEIKKKGLTIDKFEVLNTTYSDNYGSGVDLTETIPFEGKLSFDRTKSPFEMEIDFKNSSNKQFKTTIEKKEIFIRDAMNETNHFTFIIQQPDKNKPLDFNNYKLI